MLLILFFFFFKFNFILMKIIHVLSLKDFFKIYEAKK